MIPAPHGRCFKSKIKRPAFNYPASFRTIFSSHTESADFVRPETPVIPCRAELVFPVLYGSAEIFVPFFFIHETSFVLPELFPDNKKCFTFPSSTSFFSCETVKIGSVPFKECFAKIFFMKKRGGKPSLPPPAHIYERAAFICDRSLFGLQLIWQAECAEACA